MGDKLRKAGDEATWMKLAAAIVAILLALGALLRGAVVVDDPSFPWDMLTAFAAFFAVAVAWYQLRRLRLDQQAWETLKACERYETDAVLDLALRELAKARDADKLLDDPRQFRLQITSILNYLEGIAIGVQQGFYHEGIVRAHLEPIIRECVTELCTPEMLEKLGTKDDWPLLTQMIQEWNDKPDRGFHI